MQLASVHRSQSLEILSPSLDRSPCKNLRMLLMTYTQALSMKHSRLDNCVSDYNNGGILYMCDDAWRCLCRLCCSHNMQQSITEQRSGRFFFGRGSKGARCAENTTHEHQTESAYEQSHLPAKPDIAMLHHECLDNVRVADPGLYDGHDELCIRCGS